MNVEKFNLVELNAQELRTIDGGRVRIPASWVKKGKEFAHEVKDFFHGLYDGFKD